MTTRAVPQLKKLANAARVARLRSAGQRVGKNVSIGRNVDISGTVTLADGAVVMDGAVIKGQVSIGRNTRIEKLVEISGNVEIGDDCVVGGYTYLSSMPSGWVRIGNDVLVNCHSVIGANNRVDIGDHCIFAPYVHITDSSHGFDKPAELIKHAGWSSTPVTIGENVWLGSAVMVAMGVTIGAGSVIGAKALVNRDIPPMSIAYGIPARVTRNRFPENPLP